MLRFHQSVPCAQARPTVADEVSYYLLRRKLGQKGGSLHGLAFYGNHVLYLVLVVMAYVLA